jgi:hypothetical protein
MYIERAEGGGVEFDRNRNLQKICTKRTAELQAVGLTELDTTQRGIGSLCAVLKVMCCTVSKHILC